MTDEERKLLHAGICYVCRRKKQSASKRVRECFDCRATQANGRRGSIMRGGRR